MIGGMTANERLFYFEFLEALDKILSHHISERNEILSDAFSVHLQKRILAALSGKCGVDVVFLN